MHADLLLRRLAALGATDLAQDLVDRVFEGFDDALRELSVSDVGVAKRMTKMAGAYFGRAGAYGAGAGGRRRARRSPRRSPATPCAPATRRRAPARRLAARALATRRLLGDTPLQAFLSSLNFRYPLPETAP